MWNLIQPKLALISVSDKNWIIDLARNFREKYIDLISTGWTYRVLKESNIDVKEVSEYTRSPEILDGRLKTLNPGVHGWLLADMDVDTHVKQLIENNINKIDILIVNLYAFEETLKAWGSHSEIIEKIDIWWPAMLRSAAKNYNHTTVITSPEDYVELIEELHKNNWFIWLDFREKQAQKVFNLTANYDAIIAEYFNEKLGNNSVWKTAIPIERLKKLRYWENSHQSAELYRIFSKKSSWLLFWKQIQWKEMSYNNYNDWDTALDIVSNLDEPSCSIIKHANPCWVALWSNILDSYKKALESDSKSAFGWIVAVNREIDLKLAEEMKEIFFEVIIAPSISDEARPIFATKKNLRVIIMWENISWEATWRQIKSIAWGLLIQDQDNYKLVEEDITFATKKRPTKEQLADLKFAFQIVKYVKSNAIVLAEWGKTVWIGMGQTSMIGSMDIACKQAVQKIDNQEIIWKNLVLASDAFFPFSDSIEKASEQWIQAIMVTSGSIRDEEVIAKADELWIALVFTKNRHFRH